MDEKTTDLWERLKLVKKQIVYNESCKTDTVEKLKKWSRLGDSLIDNYNILSINDCVYIMDLLQTKIDSLNLNNEYLNIRKQLEI